MKQHYTDKRTGISYTLQGDYYLPDLILPVEKEIKPIGVWGQRHKRYLKEHRRVTYTNLLTTGKLNSYLAEIDKQAEEMFFRLVKEYADKQGVTEQTKAQNQFQWVKKMNNIRASVTEIVLKNIVYL